MVAALRKDHLTVPEIEAVAVPLLARILGDFGFTGIETAQDRDFEGEPVIRMTAKVQARVPARTVIDSLDAVRTELLRIGEERLVIFGTRLPPAQTPGLPDGEEDADE
jgi:hypothetical protein